MKEKFLFCVLFSVRYKYYKYAIISCPG